MLHLSDRAFWEPFAASGQAVGGFATAIGVAVTLFAALLVFWQVHHSRRLAREMGALETHREYIRLCIEQPELSCSILMLKTLARLDFSRILEDEPAIESERALWFASYVLHTMEQLFEATQGVLRHDAHWRATIWSQLDYHRDLLDEVWPKWRRHYGTRFGKMVDKLLVSPVDEPEPST